MKKLSSHFYTLFLLFIACLTSSHKVYGIGNISVEPATVQQLMMIRNYIFNVNVNVNVIFDIDDQGDIYIYNSKDFNGDEKDIKKALKKALKIFKNIADERWLALALSNMEASGNSFENLAPNPNKKSRPISRWITDLVRGFFRETGAVNPVEDIVLLTASSCDFVNPAWIIKKYKLTAGLESKFNYCKERHYCKWDYNFFKTIIKRRRIGYIDGHIDVRLLTKCTYYSTTGMEIKNYEVFLISKGNYFCKILDLLLKEELFYKSPSNIFEALNFAISTYSESFYIEDTIMKRTISDYMVIPILYFVKKEKEKGQMLGFNINVPTKNGSGSVLMNSLTSNKRYDVAYQLLLHGLFFRIKNSKNESPADLLCGDKNMGKMVGEYLLKGHDFHSLQGQLINFAVLSEYLKCNKLSEGGKKELYHKCRGVWFDAPLCTTCQKKLFKSENPLVEGQEECGQNIEVKKYLDPLFVLWKEEKEKKSESIIVKVQDFMEECPCLTKLGILHRKDFNKVSSYYEKRFWDLKLLKFRLGYHLGDWINEGKPNLHLFTDIIDTLPRKKFDAETKDQYSKKRETYIGNVFNLFRENGLSKENKNRMNEILKERGEVEIGEEQPRNKTWSTTGLLGIVSMVGIILLLFYSGYKKFYVRDRRNRSVRRLGNTSNKERL